MNDVTDFILAEVEKRYGEIEKMVDDKLDYQRIIGLIKHLVTEKISSYMAERCYQTVQDKLNEYIEESVNKVIASEGMKEFFDKKARFEMYKYDLAKSIGSSVDAAFLTFLKPDY